jgi:hypothetical protein
MNAIYNLLGNSAYKSKMLHAIPPASVVSRERYILEQVKGKIVLDIGASGPMHAAIKQAAKICYGIDRDPPPSPYYYKMNLDTIHGLPDLPGIEIVIAGEGLEHLDNAGHFLDLLKQYACPIILTTPNAFNRGGRKSIEGGIEMVNPEHVCYYSYWTLSTLVQRHGYHVTSWHWYNGQPFTAEGIIFRMERENGNG